MSIAHQIGLTLIPGVGQATAKHLLAYFGSAKAVFEASIPELVTVQGVGAVIANHIASRQVLTQAEAEQRYVEKHDIKVLFYTAPNYPQRLRECGDAPVLLYYKGNADLNQPRMLSVVGTRMATAYGKQLCMELAETLKPYGVLVVSGLAYGIDIAAHRESLRHNIPTVGVLGHGLDRIYPYHHKQIAHEMLERGGLLTEFPINTMPDRENFPKRNRIIAGLTDATLVVEATIKGGALITAELANSYHRDVYAFPGRVNDPYSQGCNFMIKTHRAALINAPKDLLYYLGWDDVQEPKNPVQQQLPFGLSIEEARIMELLKPASMLIDELASKSAISQGKLAIHLLNLEMQGLLISLPGKRYKVH